MANLNKYPVVVFFFLFFSYGLSSGSNTDSFDFFVYITNPFESAVITSDSILIRAETYSYKASAGFVSFLASYADSNSRLVEAETLGTLKNPPYEINWNISSIPDQCYGFINIWCEITPNSTIPKTTVNRQPDKPTNVSVVLDRNFLQNSRKMHLPLIKNIKVDASTSDWYKTPCIKWGDFNRVCMRAAYDKKHLFFYFTIRDSFLTAQIAANSPDRVLPLWQEDALELYFNPENHNNSIRGNREIQILISAAGGRTDNITAKNLSYNWDWESRIEYVCTPLGTLNNNSDIDSGWSVELSIPFTTFNKKGKIPDEIGFDARIFDRRLRGGNVSINSWAGTTSLTSHNPSEWGKLIFNKRKERIITFLLIAGIITVITLLIVLYKRKLSALISENPAATSKTSVLTSKKVELAKIFIDEHYTEDINMETIAKGVFTSSSWLYKTFKRQENISVMDYLMNKRINEACKILKENTDLTVSEVSYKVGYMNLSVFHTNFKKITGMTPGEYRKKGL